MFGMKDKGSGKCVRCEGKLKEEYSFCPFCGMDLRNPEKDMQDFGALGRNNVQGHPMIGGGSLGITDKMINSIFNSLMKGFEKQMGDVENVGGNDFEPEVQNLPNGIRIKINPGMKKKSSKKRAQKMISQEQVERMSNLPRTEAKTDVRRFSDKVVYELKMPGVEDVQDIFITKLESGYEVKAIGKNRVYVNSIPVNLPLKNYRVKDKVVSVEFGLQ